MASTIPDVRLSKTAYLSLYTLTGITVGTSLIIQNKTSSNIYVQQTSTAPAVTSTDGIIVEPYDFILVDGGTASQVVVVTSVSTTSATITVYQRSSVTLLSVEVLLAATTVVSGASVSVQVTSRS